MPVTILCPTPFESVVVRNVDHLSVPDPQPQVLQLGAIKPVINPLSVTALTLSYLRGRIIKLIYVNMTIFVVVRRRRNIKTLPIQRETLTDRLQREKLRLPTFTTKPTSLNALITGRIPLEIPRLTLPMTSILSSLHLMSYTIIIPSPTSRPLRFPTTTTYYLQHHPHTNEFYSRPVDSRPHSADTTKPFH